MPKKLLKSFVVVILAIGIFYSGFWYGQNARPSIEKVGGVFNKETGKPENIDFGLFWDAWARLQEKYVNRSSFESQKMVYGAISGMVKSLGDPYTVFMPPEDTKKFTDDVKGSFSGIGAEIGMRKDVLTVIAPLEDSPAKRAGLLAGDKILKIDDKITSDLALDEAISLIRGEQGIDVVLTIFRDGLNDPKEYKIRRDVIKVPILKYELKDVGDKKVAYIQLFQFTETASDEFKKTVNQILGSSAQGIVLDLRNNPGGYLEVSVDIASWFLDKGQLVVSEDFGNGKKNEHKSFGYDKLAGYSLVVLVNQGSASASEILAGALRDNLGVKLVGEKSFGKGSVQQLEELRGGSRLRAIQLWILVLSRTSKWS